MNSWQEAMHYFPPGMPTGSDSPSAYPQQLGLASLALLLGPGEAELVRGSGLIQQLWLQHPDLPLPAQKQLL